MSRSKPTQNNPNPAETFFEWRGGEGQLTWYDKIEKKSVEVPLPFRFLVLDQLATVTGYNEKLKSGVYANEVRSTKEEPLHVKFFNGEEIAKGFWREIKERVNAKSGNFATSVYIAYREGHDLKIGNLKISGCALGPWIELNKKHRKDVEAKAIILTKGEKQKVGRVEFFPPDFAIIETSKETDDQAKSLDAQLQEYLEGYFKRSRVGVVGGGDNLPGEEDYSQDIPWEEKPPLEQRESPEEEDLEKVLPKGKPDPATMPF